MDAGMLHDGDLFHEERLVFHQLLSHLSIGGHGIFLALLAADAARSRKETFEDAERFVRRPFRFVLFSRMKHQFDGRDQAFAEIFHAGFEIGAERFRFFKMPCLYRILVGDVEFRFQGFDFCKLQQCFVA